MNYTRSTGPRRQTPNESRRKGLAGHLIMLAILVMLSLFMLSRVWLTGHPKATVLCQCGDPGQSVWFMAWVPYALSHLHNPFFTTRMLAGQGGANLLESTSYLLPAFVLAPVTLVLGATASFNLAELLAPVLSGWAMYVATGRLSDRWLPRAAAGVLWGFCPFLVGAETFGHLNFSWLFAPPLLFLVLHEILAGDRLRPLTAGVLLGLLVTVQFFVGTEALLIMAMATSVGLVCAFVLAPRTALARWRRVGVAFAIGIGVAAVLLAYPLWFLTHGPRVVTGPPWPGTSVLGNPIGSIVSTAATAHSTSMFLRVGGYFGVGGPNGSYLGSWMLGVLWLSLLLSAVSRRRVAWSIFSTGLAAWLCSLGVFLVPLSPNSVQWWLPWKYLHSMPFVQSIAPGRFAFVMTACATLLLAVGLDSLAELIAKSAMRVGHKARHAHTASTHPRSPTVVAPANLVLLAILVAAGLPLARQYTFPLTMHSGRVPAWFATTARHLPANTSVLTYPYASSGAPDAMYWQAHDSLSFALVGGRALIPGADGRHSQHVDPLRGTNGLLTNDSFGSGIPSAPSRVQVDALRVSLRNWKVDVVVVVPA
ncbi:MAG: hypothetical protein ACYDBS_08455, partial [Acidimicrobiales bacterium]